MKKTYQLSVFCQPQQTAQIKAILNSAKFLTSDLVEIEIKGKFSLNVYSENKLKLATAFNKIKKLGFDLSLSQLDQKNWMDGWKNQVKPFDLLPKVRVVPAWLKHKVKPKKNDIVIDVGLVFGLGKHPTTAMMAKLINSKKGKFKTFLDIGTGSGILCVIADRCGAFDIVGVDIAPESIKQALINFKANKIKNVFLKKGDFTVIRFNQLFDFVAANLLSEDLIRLQEKIIKLVKPKGYLAVSGISKKNYFKFKTKFDHPQLSLVKCLRQSDWVGLLYQRSKVYDR